MYRAVHVCLLGACGRTGWEGLVKVWRAGPWIGGFDEFRGRIPYSLALSRGAILCLGVCLWCLLSRAPSIGQGFGGSDLEITVLFTVDCVNDSVS